MFTKITFDWFLVLENSRSYGKFFIYKSFIICNPCRYCNVTRKMGMRPYLSSYKVRNIRRIYILYYRCSEK